MQIFNRLQHHKWLSTLLRFIISFSLIYVLILFADIQLIISSFADFSIYWVLIVLILIALSVLVSAWKWATLLQALQIQISLRKLFQIYSTALFFNNFLPSSIGGDGVRIFLAGKYGGNTAAVASTVVLERTIATVTLALLGLIGAFLSAHPLQSAIWLLIGLLLIAMILSTILLAGWTPKFIQRGTRKWHQAWRHFADAAGELRKRRKAIFHCFLLSILFQLNVVIVVIAVMEGLQLQLPTFADMTYIVSASSVLAMIPIGINGFGLREGSYILLMEPFGFSAAQAMTISILFALFVSLFSLWGGINWLFVKRQK